MFRSLHVNNFKSFSDALLPLSSFTLLVGANASGKSNLREAFRFLHGAARGYTLSEIVGEKWVEGGVRVWTGLRGGSQQVAQHGQSSFGLRVKFDLKQESGRVLAFDYRIDVSVRDDGLLKVSREHLWENGRYIYDTHPDNDARGSTPPTLKARIRKYGIGSPPDDSFLDDRPLLTQLMSSGVATDATRRAARPAIDFLQSMVFLDLSPHAARESSPIGIKTLGDRGENLSSVLAEICSAQTRKDELMSWVRALTPMDAEDLNFIEDVNGRILAQLIESDGSATPLSSASDGTVRFLAMIAALMSPTRPRFLFFEELENGIHPNRVYLLLDLINQSAGRDRSQVVATSHSPQMLVHAYREAQARPCLVVRVGDLGSRIIDVRENATYKKILDRDDPASLMAAGWFEDVAMFLAPESEELFA